MAPLIQHEGIVLASTPHRAQVRIVQASTCAACQARSMCSSADSKEKVMDVVPLQPLQVGDHVWVRVEEKLGWKAVLIAYVGPFGVLMGMVTLFTILGFSETLTGTLALVVTGLYFLVLRAFRRKLQKQFTFTAVKV